MILPVIGLILLIFIIVYGFYLMIYMISLVYSFLKGAPFVRTKSKILNTILAEAHLKPKQLLIDLGCGEGQVVRIAAKKYGLKAVGYDINPLLIYRAKILAHLEQIKHAKFIKKNIFEVDIKKADVIYVFLLPKLLMALKHKLEKESKKNALIISHGFQIEGWKKYQIKKIPGSPFATYFYRLHKP